VVGYGDQEVTVVVTDDGRGVTAPTGDGRGVTAPTGDGRAEVGHGLIGMRERVQVFGGDLEVGPRPGGGFRVAARLPLGVEGR
jgi:signal transduction histidine kinase